MLGENALYDQDNLCNITLNNDYLQTKGSLRHNYRSCNYNLCRENASQRSEIQI